MAAITVYLLNTTATAPNWFGRVQDNGAAPAGALSAFGWTVAKVALTTPYWRGRIGATARATVATAGSYIDAATGPVQGTGSGATTAGDSSRSDNPLNGTFAAGNWNFTFGMRTGAASNSGRIRCHMWASANADGSGARKLTSSALIGTAVTMANATTTYNSTVTWAAPQIVLNNEYLFLQPEWQSTVVGTSNSCTAQFYQASFVTTDYVYVPATGTVTITQNDQTISSQADSIIAGRLGTLFSRASLATWFDAAGDLQTAANDVARIGYDQFTGQYLGEIFEAAGTNLISNPRAQGAVNGVIGSGGAFPTGWGVIGAGPGLIYTVSNQRVVNNVPLIDIRFSGTMTADGYMVFGFAGFPAVGPNLPCTMSFNIAIAAGSTTNVGVWTDLRFTGILHDINITSQLSAALIRTTNTSTSPPTNTRCPCLLLTPTIGQPIDITLTLGLPQLETVSAATTYILPPIGTPGVSTRAADVVTLIAEPNTIAATGTVSNPAIDGNLNQTQAVQTLVSVAETIVGSILDKTQENQALSAEGFVLEPATGDVSVAQDEQTLVAAATVVVPAVSRVIWTDYGARLQTAGRTTWTDRGAQQETAGAAPAEPAEITGTLTVTQNAQAIASTGVVVVDGDLTAIQANNTLVSSADIGFVAVTGNLTAIQAPQTIVSLGSVLVGASLTATQANNTLVSTGSVVVRGDLTATQANNTLVSVAGPVVSGNLTATQDPNTIAATVSTNVIGNLTANQAAQTLSASGSIPVTATFSATQAPQTISATGSVLSGIAGSVNVAQAANSLAATGSITGYIANLSIVQAANTLVANAGVVVRGTLTATEVPDTLVATAGAIVGGSVTATQANNTLAATGTTIIGGTLTVNQAANTLSSTGDVAVRGNLTATQAPQTLSATGSVLSGIAGSVNIVQAANSLVASGNVTGSGTAFANLSIVQAPQGLVATANSVVRGILTVTEAPDTVAATGDVVVRGGLSVIEAPDTISATGTAEFGDISGNLVVVQAPQTLTATGVSAIDGGLVVTQAPQTLTSYAFTVVYGDLTVVQADNTLVSVAGEPPVAGISTLPGRYIVTGPELRTLASSNVGNGGRSVVSNSQSRVLQSNRPRRTLKVA